MKRGLQFLTIALVMLSLLCLTASDFSSVPGLHADMGPRCAC